MIDKIITKIATIWLKQDKTQKCNNCSCYFYISGNCRKKGEIILKNLDKSSEQSIASEYCAREIYQVVKRLNNNKTICNHPEGAYSFRWKKNNLEIYCDYCSFLNEDGKPIAQVNCILEIFYDHNSKDGCLFK